MNIEQKIPAEPPYENRHSWLVRALSGLWRDIGYASRMLVKNKVFTMTALLILTLCIGANTAIFSMLYSFVIKDLPYPEPDRIVEIFNLWPTQGVGRLSSSPVQYQDFKENTDAFSHLALWDVDEWTLGMESQSVRYTGAEATAEMFDVLGVNPVLGRFFKPENGTYGNERVLVLTQSFWESYFQEDPDVIGRTIQIEGNNYEVIGIAPRSLEAFDARVRFIRPMTVPRLPEQLQIQMRYYGSGNLYGRLKPDATIGYAYGQLESIERQFFDIAPPETQTILEEARHTMAVETVHYQRAEQYRVELYLLQGVVLFVLLIGCVNVANLLLTRSNARQGEMAIRMALGAERRIIVRQLLVENILLTSLGALLGLVLAYGALGIINHFTALLLPKAQPFGIDGEVLGFTALIAIFTALFIGMFPVLHTLSGNLLALIQNQSRSVSRGRGVGTMSSALVVVQVAVTLILLIGAGLLIRSFANVLAVDPGFNPQQLIAARIALPNTYLREGRDRNFRQQLLDSLQEIPGLKSVSLATKTPFQSPIAAGPYAIRDFERQEGQPFPTFFSIGVSRSYLETMQIPLIEGRWFNDTDTTRRRQTYVVDQDFQRIFSPDRSAVGQHISTANNVPSNPEDWPEIVGVVGNVRHGGVEEETGQSFIYYPLEISGSTDISVLIRSSRSAPEVITLLREVVNKIDPTVPLYQAGQMEDIISTSFNSRRFIMLLLCSFAGIALVLSVVGIYGVLAYNVSQRTHEIGIRGAIGATGKQISILILRQGLWKTGIGLAIGIIGAFWLSRFMTSLLFEVKPTDPLAYLAVSALLLFVALLSIYLPARQAARIDPIIALRSE